MALWKITVKRQVNKVGLRLEEGMTVEVVTSSSSNPLSNNLSKNIPLINDLFKSKYGIEPGHYVNTGYMTAEKIS